MYKTISLDELLTLKNIDIVDVREKEEYLSGHIPHSINLPLSNFVSNIKSLDKTKTYYMICYSGSRSTQACMYAASQGYNVVNVQGGMSMYRGELSYEV